jgi:hypothetical protein
MEPMATQSEQERRQLLAEHMKRGRAHLERAKARAEASQRHLDGVFREIERLKRASAR